MKKIINLQLADPDAYKPAFIESYKDLPLIDVIFEILGSVKKNENNKLKIEINIQNDNIFICHNGEPLDQKDMNRLLQIATQDMKENKKGVSKHGIGWRAIACTNSRKNFEKDGYKEEDFLRYSSMLSKIKTDIIIDDDEQINKDNIISLIHDDYFHVCFDDGEFYTNIYNEYLNNGYGVLFIIPNSNNYDYNDSNIVHKLQLLYNRFDCDIIYQNHVTKYKRDIFKNRPFYYIDDRIKNTDR